MDAARELFGLAWRIPARLLVKLWFGARVTTDPEIHKLRNVIIVCNHPSVLDPPLLFGRFPRGTWYTGTQKVMLRYPILRILKALPIVFFPAEGLRKHEMIRLNQIAGKGRNIVIFPQADCVHPDAEFACYPGFWRVARRAKVEMVYVGIDGTHRIFDWENDRKIKRGRTVALKLFGRLGPDCTEEEAIEMFRQMIDSLRTK
ncbi:MAG: 1-acyl-sn-glycerol-3-phosphate acyltransferase [Chthonomonas sp.]|nr:1-acyl-sn-glycerol-3-phosphate acyltransferase [Chthonomonas sp.]